jgi:general secretion pathway protein L
MNVTYFVQISANNPQQCLWLRFNEKTPAGTVAPGSLDEVLKQASGQRLVVIISSTDVTMMQLSLKAKSSKQIASAIPFALEEELADDIDNLHFSSQSIVKNRDKQLVAVVSRAFMQTLFDHINALEFQFVSVVPQTLVVPFSEGNWTLFVQANSATLRTSEFDGYGLDLVNVPNIVALEADQQQQAEEISPEIFLYNYSEETINIADISSSVSGRETDALPLMGKYWLDHQTTLNLLQGDFRVQRELPLASVEWRIAASLAAIAVLLFLLGLAVDNYRFANQNAQLDRRMNQLYEDIFEQESASPAGDMRKRIIALQGDSTGEISQFLQYISSSGAQLIQGNHFKVSRIQFNGTVLELDIETDSMDKLEQLQKKIAPSASQAELKAVSNDNGKIRARIVVSEEA